MSSVEDYQLHRHYIFHNTNALHLLIITTERRESTETNIENNAETPHVNAFAVLRVSDDFRCNYRSRQTTCQYIDPVHSHKHKVLAIRHTITGCSTDGVEEHLLANHLGKTEIRDLDSHSFLIHD